MSDIKPQDIEALLETFEASSWSELKVKVDGLELFVSKTPGARAVLEEMEVAAPVAPASQAPAAHGPASQASSITSGATKAAFIPEDLLAVRAPNLGTFYRAPKPGA